MSKAVGRTLAVATLMALLPSRASAARLLDGTRLHVRLLRVITSESSAIGEPLDFVVSRDVVDDAGDVVIARGTRVTGTLVDAARVKLGFFTHPPRLAFTFDHATARGGQVIRIRASATPQLGNRVVVDRGERHHRLQWADGGDLFDAFVDGNYDVLTSPP